MTRYDHYQFTVEFQLQALIGHLWEGENTQKVKKAMLSKKKQKKKKKTIRVNTFFQAKN